MTSIHRYADLLLALLSFGAATALAQPAPPDWPSKPVRIVIPYTAGSTSDLAFRPLAPLIEARLGQRFVIENKPGASGNIGAGEVARAAPNGYTLLVGAVGIFTANKHLVRSMNFDPLTAFDPIALVSDAPTIIVVNAGLPVGSLRELAAHARANPGKLNFSSPGIGTAPHLAAELFAAMAGVQMVHVPFSGSPPAVLALQQGEVQVYFSIYGAVAGLLRSGAAKALAVSTATRLPILPQVPTTAESGFPELLTGAWQAMVAPRGTDARILDRLNAEVRQALTDPVVRKLYADIGFEPGNLGRAELSAFMRNEAARWKKVIETANVQAQ